MKKFADVILPLPLHSCFTYSLPDEWADEVQTGCRVVVPFGRKKYYTAIVRNVHYCAPTEYEVKEVSALLDARPILLPRQFKFWEWLSDYYLCTQGDVYKAALPSGLKLESETIVEYNPDFESDVRLPEKEQKILDMLSADPEQCVTKLEKETGIKNILSVIKSLLDKEAIFVKEELRRTYKPKTETRVRLTAAARNEHRLHIFFDELQRRAPKQLDLLMKYLELSGYLSGRDIKEVSKAELLQRTSTTPAVFNGLVDRGVFEVYQQEIGRIDKALLKEVIPVNPLNEHQQRAYHSILENFQSKNVCLLHGVTASGKTEVYIHLIEETIRQGKQVLYLLPEIALTAQITERLQRVFGSRLGIYHSKFPDAERVEIWQKQLSEADYDIILGVRSSVFLPFRNLGLVIVDEEHENTYKQQDPAPRYHARNAAIVLASMYGAKTLLGTATPSVETWHNATTGKYGLVELKERYKEIQLPEIIPVDIKELHRKKMMKGPFSPLLLQYIREALEQKEQVILFQNRRGFAPMIECNTCGWVPKCKNCDVSLTYHKGLNQLTCHYCGYTYQLPRICPACEGTDLRNRGFGTEKIEDDIKALFPDARVAPYGLGHHPHPYRLRAHHLRFPARQDGHPDRHANGVQGSGLRPRQHCGHTQCRHHAELSRLPRLRARLPADGAGCRTRRTEEQARQGGATNQKHRPSHHPASHCQRLRSHGRRAACRTPDVPLPALLPPGVCLPEEPERDPARPHGTDYGRQAPHRLWQPCAGTGQAARSTRTDPVHPKDCLEDRNQCPDGPCPRTARPGAKGDGGGRPLQVADSVL